MTGGAQSALASLTRDWEVTYLSAGWPSDSHGRYVGEDDQDSLHFGKDWGVILLEGDFIFVYFCVSFVVFHLEIPERSMVAITNALETTRTRSHKEQRGTIGHHRSSNKRGNEIIMKGPMWCTIFWCICKCGEPSF